MLIFNCTSGRSGLSLLGTLLSTISPSTSSSPFSHAIFCTNTTYASGDSKGGTSLPLPSRTLLTRSVDLTSKAVDASDLSALTTQHELAAAWSTLTSSHVPQAEVHVLGSIEEAVKLARAGGEEVDVLVCGSLHLVGGVMAVAELPLEL